MRRDRHGDSCWPRRRTARQVETVDLGHTSDGRIIHYGDDTSWWMIATGVEFIVFDIGGKYPGWDIHSYMHYAQFEGKRYFWCGAGAPKEFVGDWRFMYDTPNALAGDIEL